MGSEARLEARSLACENASLWGPVFFIFSCLRPVFGVPDRDDAVDGDLDKAETKDAVKLASSKAEAGNLDGLGKDLLLKGATAF